MLSIVCSINSFKLVSGSRNNRTFIAAFPTFAEAKAALLNGGVVKQAVVEHVEPSGVTQLDEAPWDNDDADTIAKELKEIKRQVNKHAKIKTVEDVSDEQWRNDIPF